MLTKCELVSGVLLKVVLSLVGIALVAVLAWALYTIPYWMKFWEQAGGDISKVATAINSFDKSMSKNTAIMARSMPEMLVEMRAMRQEITVLRTEVEEMKRATTHLAATVPPQMDIMQNRLGKMNYTMTPAGMMNPMNW